jgi:hypothetical protein
MDSHYYSDIPPGGASLRGAGYTPWFARGITSPGADWTPDVVTDPEPFDSGPPGVGEVPSNIEAGGDWPVAADFGGGVDEGPIADNIHVD